MSAFFNIITGFQGRVRTPDTVWGLDTSISIPLDPALAVGRAELRIGQRGNFPGPRFPEGPRARRNFCITKLN